MKPVTQTQFGHDPSDPETCGNCMAACVASLLELELSEVPNFMLAGDAGWWNYLQLWLSHRGLAYIEIRLVEGTKAELHLSPDTHYIMVGKSPRGNFNHAVVYREHELAHDPHPSGDGIETTQIMGFMVPHDLTNIQKRTHTNVTA